VGSLGAGVAIVRSGNEPGGDLFHRAARCCAAQLGDMAPPTSAAPEPPRGDLPSPARTPAHSRLRSPSRKAEPLSAASGSTVGTRQGDRRRSNAHVVSRADHHPGKDRARCDPVARQAAQRAAGAAPSRCGYSWLKAGHRRRNPHQRPQGRPGAGRVRGAWWTIPRPQFSLLFENGAPEGIRTPGLCLRRAALYPAELRVRGLQPRGGGC
jgi:hypothetical protein